MKQSNLKKKKEHINLTNRGHICVIENAKNSEPLIQCSQCFKSHWPHKKACLQILSKKDTKEPELKRNHDSCPQKCLDLIIEKINLLEHKEVDNDNSLLQFTKPISKSM